MSAPPVDEHTEEFEQLAGLVALNVLEGDELDRFQRHAARCERCQTVMRLDGQALARLALTAPEMEPSPDFKARLLARAAQELAATQAASPAPPPVRAEPIEFRPRSNVVPLWRRSPWMRAVAAVFVVGLVSAGVFSYENQPVATYELSGSVPGTARVIVRRSGRAELEMQGVPDPGAEYVYEAWVIPPGEGQQPVPVDITPRGDATIGLPTPTPGTTVAVTRERGRVNVPTLPILLAGKVTG